MPVIEVELVESADAEPAAGPPSGLAQRLADDLGEALESAPGRTWVRIRRLARHDYAENGVPLDDDLAPVFVTVTESRRPRGSALEERVHRVTTVIAAALNRPAMSVHVIYAEDGAGRVAFGGSLVG